MPKKSKQNEGLKAYKKTRAMNRYNATSWARMQILAGRDRQEILTEMSERYGYALTTCKLYYEKADALAQLDFSKDSEKLRTKNLQRLESFVDASTEEGDLKTAMAAMDMQNKMTGSYLTKVDIKNDGDEPFKLVID